MSKEYEVELPGKLTIEIDEETGEGTGESVSALAPEDGGGRQGILEGFKRRPYIPRRPEDGITLYDLGAVLLSSGGEHPLSYMRPRAATDKPVPGDGKTNEYVERELWYNLHPVEFGVEITLADMRAYDRELLGHLAVAEDALDPTLETPANKSGRKVSNVLRWAKDFYTDFSLRLYSGGESRSFNKASDKWKKDGGKLEGEVWNSRNLTDNLVQEQGILKAAKKGATQVAIDSPNIYRSLDTGDTETYKVTTAPDYAADRKDFKLALPLRLYLVPDLYFFIRTAVAYAEVNGRWVTDTILDHTEIVTLPDRFGHPVDWEIKYYTWEEGGAGEQIILGEAGEYFATRYPIYPIIPALGDAGYDEAIKAIFDRNVGAGASHAARLHYIRSGFIFRRKYTMRVSFLYPLLITSEVLPISTSWATEEFTETPDFIDLGGLEASNTAEAAAFITANSTGDVHIIHYPIAEDALQFVRYPLYKAGQLAGVVKAKDKLYYVWYNKDIG
jgi:hypothetical protein